MSVITTKVAILVGTRITDAMFISSTVAETEYGVYNPITTYGVGDRCIKNHGIYESLKASNTGHDPENIANQQGAPAWWLFVDPTNKWACLDEEVGTQTIGITPLTMVFRPGFANSIFLGNITDATHLKITVKDAPGGNVIWTYDQDLESSYPADYYEHFFSPFEPQTSFIGSGIEPYNNMEFTITLTAASGNIGLGMLQIGDLRICGDVEYNPSMAKSSNSIITKNKFGKTKIVRRRSATDLNGIVAKVDIMDANALAATLEAVLDVPSVVVCTDLPEYAALRTFGLIKGVISYPKFGEAQLQLDVTGMI